MVNHTIKLILTDFFGILIQTSMNKNIMLISTIIAIVMFLFIVLLVETTCNNSNRYKNNFRNRSFHGIVTGISYDAKKIPTVRILDSNYYLGIYSYGVSEFLKANDSLVKLKNEDDYILYRKDSSGIWQAIYGRP